MNENDELAATVVRFRAAREAKDAAEAERHAKAEAKRADDFERGQADGYRWAREAVKAAVASLEPAPF